MAGTLLDCQPTQRPGAQTRQAITMTSLTHKGMKSIPTCDEFLHESTSSGPSSATTTDKLRS
jgi:hypothetical protein